MNRHSTDAQRTAPRSKQTPAADDQRPKTKRDFAIRRSEKKTTRNLVGNLMECSSTETAGKTYTSSTKSAAELDVPVKRRITSVAGRRLAPPPAENGLAAAAGCVDQTTRS